MMPALPQFDTGTKSCSSPHVVILGAGASRAATPEGDANGQTLPVMSDFVEKVGLTETLSVAGVPWRNRNFEDAYCDLRRQHSEGPLLQEIEDRIRSYFASLLIPSAATAYDQLLLSMREKDFIATFNWDPLLVQAYQRVREVRRLPRIFFLHGNVAIGICTGCKVRSYLGTTCGTCGRPLTPTKLLYPIKEKNYSEDPYISSEWEGLRTALRHAYLLTVFGYSAPSSDEEAKELMRVAWSTNQTRQLAQIEIIDLRPEEDLVHTWKPFITSHHYSVRDSIAGSFLTAYPRRSCEALLFATLQNDPLQENRPPKFESVSALRSWISPLLDEEADLENSGRPFSGSPCPQVLQ